LELRHLQHFIAVAEELNFTRAADRIHIVQSALSTSIRSLEQELQTPLLVRSTRQVQLTPAGRAFLERAREALRVIEGGRETVAEIAGLRRGSLCIGTVHSSSPARPHRSSRTFAAWKPVVAARSIRATGRSQRT